MREEGGWTEENKKKVNREKKVELRRIKRKKRNGFRLTGTPVNRNA